MVRLPSTRLAFYSDRGGDYQVWTVKRDGSALQQLTRVNEGSVSYPVWSPDGSRMKFTVPGRGKVYLFDPRKPWSPQVPEELPPCPLTERGGFGVSS